MTKVLVAEMPEEKRQVYRFRYEIYVEEMQKKPRSANHIEKILEDELDETAILLYITVDDQIIATLRRNLFNASSSLENLNQIFLIDQIATTFSKTTLSFSSRLMVAPQWRNSATLGAIVAEAYRHARELGLQFDFLHASPWLVPFYENLGYRRYTQSFLDQDTGLQIPMVLILEDIEHLRAVRSPFYRLARKFSNSSVAKDWFSHTFPEPMNLINTCRSTTDEVWEFWLKQLHQQSHQQIELFQGLTNECVQQLLKASFFHRVKAGETILRTGDIANAVFLVLSGVVKVSSTATSATSRLTSCQTFGEATLFTQLPSPESAIALTEVELLVLPRQTIIKAMKTAPEAMCQFFFNASCWLCHKYVPDMNLVPESPPLAVAVS